MSDMPLPMTTRAVAVVVAVVGALVLVLFIALTVNERRDDGPGDAQAPQCRSFPEPSRPVDLPSDIAARIGGSLTTFDDLRQPTTEEIDVVRRIESLSEATIVCHAVLTAEARIDEGIMVVDPESTMRPFGDEDAAALPATCVTFVEPSGTAYQGGVCWANAPAED